MLKSENAVLIVIDVQEKLAYKMHEKEALFETLQKIIKGIQVLEIPIIWAEQYPEGLGKTIPEVADLLTDIQPISKRSFSCCDNQAFMQKFKAVNRKQVLIVGIETHVCVYQTAMNLLELGYEIQIVADAVSSRRFEDKKIGLERMRSEGAKLASTEMVLFELLRVAKGEKFKEILKIVK